MPDQTTRDAVRNCFCPAAWCRAHGCPTRRCTAKADAVLSALGIPPDTTTDEVRAGLAVLRILAMLADEVEEHYVHPWSGIRPGHEAIYGIEIVVAEEVDTSAVGASPAAAVLALAAKLGDGDRG